MTDHLAGPIRFVLAGSGHIAGVVNPPEADKYQYWINEGEARSLEEFANGATEHSGSWWPDWIEWLRAQDRRNGSCEAQAQAAVRAATASSRTPLGATSWPR